MPDRWVYVTAYDPDGRPTHTTNATAWLGTDSYAKRIVVLRRGLEAGHTLDTADADALHERMVEGQRRLRAAHMAWMADGAPVGGHPGSLAEWMPK